ncbi:MAG TPA: CoA-acylating methylmalonate-semialdehyde dehydrogenase [Gemmataceae bacterium]|jgi:malonate-semialdehyde dehydrogenase (acetylating)/methylmalonate-semialdehyde dehydrogenase|nr:CoA-acylating methylmalonate-semialdehyde dehydrogenase [Gemmataceae bacterium]
MIPRCKNFIAGEPRDSQSAEWLDVTNPATGEVLAKLPLATSAEVDDAVAAARQAFAVWGETPVVERARVLFRFKQQLEDNRQELAELVVLDNGKTLAEANGEVQRGIEAVEFATGIPSHSMGMVIEDAAQGIDSELFRQPLGVVAGFTPFNFPVMVPLWMIPVAVACGNTFVLKPSERAPLATVRLAELFAACGAPRGVLNVVHGTRAVAERIMAHPHVQAVSVVGSSPVARHVYTSAAAHGKRVQALGGAKNALIVLPDADLQDTVKSIVSSAFGCAGQRCLAGSNVVAAGSIAEPLVKELTTAASSLKLGSGLDADTNMGPVISPQAKDRVLSYIHEGARAGAKLARDGRHDWVRELPNGYFVGPTVFDEARPDMAIARDEIFGPVLTVLRVRDLNEAIDMVNTSPLGNSASLYTTSGGAARTFRRRIEAGMLGINVGVPAPMAFFPFSGWKGSFFGDLHAQGKEVIEFYTRRKVVTSRWT